MMDARKEAGVALAILLWFIAAMSLLVGTIMYQARIDIKLSQLRIQQAQAEALGDGATQLALVQRLKAQQDVGFSDKVTYYDMRLADHDVKVRMLSVSGLVDLNTSPETLLLSVFKINAGLSEEQASLLASKVVAWRSASRLNENDSERVSSYKVVRYGRFESLEDLMMVEGMTREIYDKVKNSIYVGQLDSAQVHMPSAPFSVLTVLAEGDEALASQWQLARQSEQVFTPTGINTEWVAASPVAMYRIESRVRFLSGEVFQRTRWVEQNSTGYEGLPWRFIRTEPVVRVEAFDFVNELGK